MANELTHLNDSQLIQNLQTLGTEFAKSGILGVSNPSQGLIVALTCYTEHISPIEFARTYHIVNGRLSIRADAMQAQFLRQGGRIRWITSTNEKCEAVFSHPEYAPEGVTLSLTIEEMVNSGVAVDGRSQLKQTWKSFPRQMLRARVVSEGCRMLTPGIVAGIYTPEEVSEFGNTPARTLDLSKSTKQEEVPVQALPESESESESESEPEPASEPKDITELLIEKEAIVNNFLCDKLHWITGGQTWRNLAPRHMDSIKQRTAQFLEKAEAYFKEQYDE